MIFSKRVLSISLIVIIAGLLFYFFFLKKGEDSLPEESSESASVNANKHEESALPVRVATARRGDLVIKLKSPGEAVTDRKIIMKAEVSGLLKKLMVKESQHVRKGDLLIELDDREYRLELERSEAARLKALSDLLLEKRFAGPEDSDTNSNKEVIPKAEKEYEKTRKLYEKGLISREKFIKLSKEYEYVLIESGDKKEEIMAATKGLTDAEINVKKAQIELEKTKIRAPFSGIVCDIQISPQEKVVAGRELFTLVNIDRVQVNAKVLESEIGKMKIGREVELKFSAYPEKIFKGKVKAISPLINPEDKTCKVIIDMLNPEEQIKPGMHAEVEIAAEIHKNKLLIPQEAVLVRGGRKLAFVEESGLAKWRYIEVGLENDDYVEVLSGIKEKERVVIEGHFTLAHDARVRIVK